MARPTRPPGPEIKNFRTKFTAEACKQAGRQKTNIQKSKIFVKFSRHSLRSLSLRLYTLTTLTPEERKPDKSRNVKSKILHYSENTNQLRCFAFSKKNQKKKSQISNQNPNTRVLIYYF